MLTSMPNPTAGTTARIDMIRKTITNPRLDVTPPITAFYPTAPDPHAEHCPGVSFRVPSLMKTQV